MLEILTKCWATVTCVRVLLLLIASHLGLSGGATVFFNWWNPGVEISADNVGFLTLSLPESVVETLKVILTFEFVDEILWWNHSNDNKNNKIVYYVQKNT